MYRFQVFEVNKSYNAEINVCKYKEGVIVKEGGGGDEMCGRGRVEWSKAV